MLRSIFTFADTVGNVCAGGFSVKQGLFSTIEGSHDTAGEIKCSKFEVIQLFRGMTYSKLEEYIVTLEGDNANGFRVIQ